ncbi:MAG TPA: YqzL family protein [Clostridia bacterium]
MLKEFVWKAFEATGDVDTYMFFREIEERDKVTKERNAAHEEAAISNAV